MCKNVISSQKFEKKYYNKICKFLKMRAKRAKICNLYVQFNSKVEKGGHWVWTEEKRGVIGCEIGVKKGGLLTGTWDPPMYGSAPPGGYMGERGVRACLGWNYLFFNRSSLVSCINQN